MHSAALFSEERIEITVANHIDERGEIDAKKQIATDVDIIVVVVSLNISEPEEKEAKAALATELVRLPFLSSFLQLGSHSLEPPHPTRRAVFFRYPSPMAFEERREWRVEVALTHWRKRTRIDSSHRQFPLCRIVAAHCAWSHQRYKGARRVTEGGKGA